MLEKELENDFKRRLKINGVKYHKVHGGSYQESGMADLLVFHKYKTYAIEIKRDFKKSPVKKLQALQAVKFKEDLIYLFLDSVNFDFVVKNVILNNAEILKHYGKKQIDYWIQFYKDKTGEK